MRLIAGILTLGAIIGVIYAWYNLDADRPLVWLPLLILGMAIGAASLLLAAGVLLGVVVCAAFAIFGVPPSAILQTVLP